jgi:uncharacterized RDD family membrane protein YckC
MQCPSCFAVLLDGDDLCAECKGQAVNESESVTMNFSSPEENSTTPLTAGADESESPRLRGQHKKRSTLIEFPGTNARANKKAKPQWRQELSERVREFQERKNREAEENPASNKEYRVPGTNGQSLGVVTPSESPEVNRIVTAALQRIEKARQNNTPSPRRSIGSRGGATALARAPMETYEEKSVAPAMVEPATEVITAPETSLIADQKVDQQTADIRLVVVPPKVLQAAVEVAAVEELPPPIEDRSEKLEPRKVIEGVVDDAFLSQIEEKLLPPVAHCEPLENYAPLGLRAMAATLDVLIAMFLASPFAAVIELTNSNWSDSRVQIAMASIFVLIMFLYHTASFGLSGRTFGMSFFSLRTVDSKTGVHPSTMQSIGRSISFIVVLLTGFLGCATALMDGERRTLHDMLSRTVVVKEQ